MAEQGSNKKGRTGRLIVLVAFVVLFIVHQDQWFWTDDRLWFGFMPTGLLYHALYSVAAAVLWWLAAKFAWPDELESFASGGDDSTPIDEESSE
jgi:hypothetical protein